MSDAAEQELDVRGWDTPPLDHVPGLSDEERSDWLDVRATVRMLAADEGWSMGETARRADVSPPTFNTWYSGKSRGNIPNTTAKLRRFLRADEERRTAAATLVEPGFVRTKTAGEVMTALLYAQQLPGIALVTLGPGMGKTTCLREVLRTRPHTYAITASRSVRTTPAVNREIAARLDLGLNPATIRNRIGERLQRNTKRSLLIVDEAQNLCDEAVDELRHFLDQNSCGIALLGNEDVIGRWGDARPLTQFDRVQADAIERMATRLGRMASTLRMSLGRAPGTLGAAMEQQSKGFTGPNWMRPKGPR